MLFKEIIFKFDYIFTVHVNESGDFSLSVSQFSAQLFGVQTNSDKIL
jgi:hypothetical protein